MKHPDLIPSYPDPQREIDTLRDALASLHSAAVLFRQAVYMKNPSLRLRNEPVNRLSAELLRTAGLIYGKDPA